MAQNDKSFCLSHSISQELYIMWFLFIVHICLIIISPGGFFFFCFNFDFRVVRGLKNSISQKLYIIWFSRMVHLWKMMISPCVFFIYFFFFNLIFCFWVVKMQRIVQNDKKFVCRTPYLRNHTSYDCHLCYTSVKWWYLRVVFFSFFQNFDFLGC